MKEKIIEESIKLFEKKGFTQTSIQDIVESQGVTKGTFYYYFQSKEQLLMDIHLMYINDILNHQQRILNNEKKSCKEKLKEIVMLVINHIDKQGSAARIFYREVINLNPEHITEVLEKRDLFRIQLEKLIEEGVKKGEFRNDLNPAIISFSVLGMCNWAYTWFNPKGPMSEEEVIHIFIEMILNGILPQ